MLISSIPWKDTLQLALLAALALYCLRVLSRTPGRNVAYGIAAVLLLYGLMKWLGLSLLAGALEVTMRVGVIILFILFRDEARTLLGHLGRRSQALLKLGAPLAPGTGRKAIDEIASTVDRLSRNRTGALIAIERDNLLSDYAATGYELGAPLSSPLLEAIFTSRSPMHDGAVIVRGDQVVAAGAVLPLSKGSRGTTRYGTRHRAALGLCEATDAVVVVVSEERGTISVARDGALIPIDPEHVRGELQALLSGDAPPELSARAWPSPSISPGRIPEKIRRWFPRGR